MKKKSGRDTKFQRRRMVRLTAAEDKKLRAQADSAVLSGTGIYAAVVLEAGPLLSERMTRLSGNRDELGVCSSIILRASGQREERKVWKK